MKQQPSTPANQAANPATHERPGDPRQASGSEALHIRSYDHQWAYDIEVELLAADGTSVFHKQYYLLPGRIESEASAIPSGDYRLRVTLDNEQRETLDCRIGESPGHTAVVEIGNGVVALAEGF